MKDLTVIDGGEGKNLRERTYEVLSGGMTQSKFARECGLSATTLSQWLKGTYPGSNEEVEAAVGRWFAAQDLRTEEEYAPEPGWQATPTAVRIQKALVFAQAAARMVVIYGGAGLGKSVTARHYSRNFNNVWMVSMTPSYQSLVGMLQEIAYACGARGTSSKAYVLRREILDRLVGTRGLLILDEAQHMTDESLEEARRLYDDSGIGLVLSGNESVYGRLGGTVKSAKFAQVFSRVGMRLKITKPTAGDVEAVMAAWKVTDAAGLKVGREIASQPGALRGLTTVLQIASKFAGADPPSAEHLRRGYRITQEGME